MKNLITAEIIGKEFFNHIKYIRPDSDDYPYVFKLLQKSMFDGKILKEYSDIYLLDRIHRRAHVQTKNVNLNTCYLVEDTCGNIEGFSSLANLDITSNVGVVAKKLGNLVVRSIIKDECKMEEFVTFLHDFALKSLITMTQSYIAVANSSISIDSIKKVWENENHSDFFKSIDNMLDWDSCEDFIADTLYDVVIEDACRNVHGSYTLTQKEMTDIKESVSCDTWENIFKIWENNEKAVNEKREEVGIATNSGGSSFNVLMNKVASLKVGEYFDFQTRPLGTPGWIFSIGKIDLFDCKCFMLSANEYVYGEAIYTHDIEDLNFESFKRLTTKYDEYEGIFIMGGAKSLNHD